MAARQSTPKRGNTFAVNAACLVLATLHAGSAFASANSPFLCDDVADLALNVPAEQLQANVVSHDVDAKSTKKSPVESEAVSPGHYLTPRFEAALRKVFEDTTASLADGEKPANNEEAPEMNTRVPGVSDEDLARFKRQMYRIDI